MVTRLNEMTLRKQLKTSFEIIIQEVEDRKNWMKFKT